MLQDFSSLPPEQEREFVVFEQRLQANSKSATMIGGIVAGVLGLLIVAIVFGGDKGKPVIEMPEEAEAEVAAEPSRPAAAEPPAEEPAAAAEAAPAEAEAEAEAPAQEAPKPPPGATKAPPTALTGDK